MAHPKVEVLNLFFKNSSEIDDEILKIIEEVSDQCEVCRKFKKSPNRLKVGLPTRAGKRGAARQQCFQKEIDRTISGRRTLVN